MADELEIINGLAGLAGILPYYFDLWGHKHITSFETKKAILNAMGVPLSEDELKKRRLKPWNRFIEPVMVASYNSQPISIPIHFPLKKEDERHVRVTWSLKGAGDSHRPYFRQGSLTPSSDLEAYIDGIRYVRLHIKVNSAIALGYYDLDVRCICPPNELNGRMRLIITPDVCHTPEEMTWGFTVNLYSIYSKESSGIGDFSDLKGFVEKASKLGAGFVGINPLHATPNKPPYGISPYSPISRLYRNFIYLRTAAPEGKKNPLTQFIDYEKTASLKEKALKEEFSVFYKKHYLKNTPSAREFKTYISEEAMPLESFSVFMAIAGSQPLLDDPYDWRGWHEGFKDPKSPEVREFRDNHGKEILFYQYVQWLIDKELKVIQQRAGKLGMAVGLYHDLAVGSTKGGSDAWTYKHLFADGINVGAPPDAFNLNGQDWGVLAFIPEKLREAGYEPFIETIRKNLRHAGALRIDHALGLFRLFWIPKGMKPQDGAYVSYPSEDLLRIIALESKRNKAVIIAEDLGTVPEEVRETLRRFHMLSYRLFYFERNWPMRDFILPPFYPQMAFAGVSTHDLPTLAGYWLLRDMEMKKALSLYPDEVSFKRDIEERKIDKKLILSVLGGSHDLEEPMTAKLCMSIYKFLSLTPCSLVGVSLDDIIGVIDQQNMPGTATEYPNWSRRMPLGVDEIFKDKGIKALKEIFRDRSILR